ncbi:uncharacterized protein LY89DRAFT_734746 [Mollisia scopiformis]|uniref:Uncharacterized protein n=1 Tax=Mollisia scopiformis TaxID=149040 RepID=A0A194XA63_MOLSC|nr:uncharacterized protein LY89DRAFT_734746 [Mollisia scopiformis]KUJ16652.1 hypothetical protein LY89DRAFT_734746 [Mollisia scopiformis]
MFIWGEGIDNIRLWASTVTVVDGSKITKDLLRAIGNELWGEDGKPWGSFDADGDTDEYDVRIIEPGDWCTYAMACLSHLDDLKCISLQPLQRKDSASTSDATNSQRSAKRARVNYTISETSPNGIASKYSTSFDASTIALPHGSVRFINRAEKLSTQRFT